MGFIPSFSITRSEAALCASAPAITRSRPATSKAYPMHARAASVARPLPEGVEIQSLCRCSLARCHSAAS
jgi:hypothetical protein